MSRISYFVLLTLILILNCNSNKRDQLDNSNVISVGAMRDVMWKGELDGKIKLDTIKNKSGLYGLGPEIYLSGEILINNGKIFVSRVVTDSAMIVEEKENIEAPFFVYGNVNNWTEMQLPKTITSIKSLEEFINDKTKTQKRPFAFKLRGTISSGVIHVQNLPKGTKVSSPKEAHQGQVNYKLASEHVEIIGFFSTEHQGIFTHHDSYLHMHLITKDLKKMGHLDEVIFDNMTLFLPKS
ncbi:MAG: acetolactate decarboxylase [Bacteroidota bacterium]